MNVMTASAKNTIFILIICLVPFLLNLLGVEFSSAHIAGEINTLPNVGNIHHAILDWTAICIAVIASGIAFLHYRRNGDVPIAIIGLVLFSSAIVDGFHTLAATRIIEAISGNQDFIPFTWALSRLFNATVIIIGVTANIWFYHQTNNKTAQQQLSVRLLIAMAIIFIGATVIVVGAAMSATTLPQTMYLNAVVTRPFDVLPLTLFLLAATLISVWLKQDYSTIKFAILLSMIPEIFTQLHMAFGSTALYDNHFNIAHSLKIIAYATVLVGLWLTLNHRKLAESPSINSGDTNSNSSFIPQKSLEVGKAKNPLTIQLPLMAFLISLIITLVVSLTFYAESARLSRKQVLEDLHIKASLVAPLLERVYLQSTADTLFLSNTPPIQGIIAAQYLGDHYNSDLWRDRLAQIFEQILKNKFEYDNISYIRTVGNLSSLVTAIRQSDGNIMVSVDENSHPFAPSVIQQTLSKKTTETFISSATLSADNIVSFQVATPIYTAGNNELFGVVLIDVNFSHFLQQLKENVLNNLAMFLTNHQGIILNENADKSLYENTPIQQLFPSLTDILTQEPTSFPLPNLMDNQQRSKISFLQRLGGNEHQNQQPLYLLLQDVNQSNSELYNIRTRSIWLGIALAILALTITIITSRRMVSPISNLTDALKQYDESGKLQQLPITATNEVGVLARTFHNMMLHIGAERSENQRITAQSLESANLLESILNSVVDSIITINKKGEILSFNQAAESMFGYHKEEVIGRNISCLMPEHYAQHHDGYINAFINTRDSKIIGIGRELIALRKDQSTFPIHLAISESNTTKGVIFTGIIRDISAKKAAEEEINRTLSQLEAIMEATDIGLFVVSNSGDVIRFNQRLCELWQLTADQVSQFDQNAMLEYMGSRLVNPETLKLSTVVEADNNTNSEANILELKSGSVLHFSSNQMLINNTSLGQVWGFRDITMHKQVENSLIAAKEEAELTVRYKSEFLASMSHEIRTPMNGVLGMLDLLRGSDLNQEQSHRADLAYSSATSLLAIINDILDFSKVEAGKLELDIIDFDLLSHFYDVIETMAIKAEEKGLELILDASALEQSMVKGDPSRLRQILTNLISNAIKFTAQGEIIVRIKLSQFNSNLRLQCQIIDSGIGIPADKISLLFNSFTQVDASTTRKYGGTGLGLTIVKQLCELMGGGVSAESEYGKGSTFNFNIELESSSQRHAPLPQIKLENTDVLIVDDNNNNIEILTGQLQRWQANVTSAQSAEDALLKLAQYQSEHNRPFALAILDMQMPDMDGLTLAKKVRSFADYDAMKMIMLTSVTKRGDSHLFHQAGFSAYFPKPVKPSDLSDAIAILLNDEGALTNPQPLVTRHSIKSMHDNASEGRVEYHNNDATSGTESLGSWPSNTRILLIEDNFINQAVALAQLEDMQLQADVANNGIEALAKLNGSDLEAPYDLILMDCQMPEMDGFEATAAIRDGAGGEHYRRVPIIALTANAMKEDQDKCLAAGMDDYLSKPFNPDDLREKLQHWLG
ncbi:response regulator [Alteromonadaceae bacterium BrNp21-10]|nr:response regulator [Alteromonadaceae bacterium BrNp21-10]